MENEKSREDYQNECYRLTFQLKKARDKLKQLTDKNLSEKDKNQPKLSEAKDLY